MSTVNLKDLLRQKKEGVSSEAPSSPFAPSKPIEQPKEDKPFTGLMRKAQTQKEPEVPKAKIYYFYSVKPDIGFKYGRNRIAFKGNYFETMDKAVADYILAHFGKYVEEIDREMSEDRKTIKE